jgi:hypothetical protein
MKKLIYSLLVLVPVIILSTFNPTFTQPSYTASIIKLQDKTENVYICTGKYSKRYHSTPLCSGLNNCRSDIIEVSKRKAKNLGRTPCKICYSKLN